MIPQSFCQHLSVQNACFVFQIHKKFSRKWRTITDTQGESALNATVRYLIFLGIYNRNIIWTQKMQKTGKSHSQKKLTGKLLEEARGWRRSRTLRNVQCAKYMLCGSTNIWKYTLWQVSTKSQLKHPRILLYMRSLLCELFDMLWPKGWIFSIKNIFKSPYSCLQKLSTISHDHHQWTGIAFSHFTWSSSVNWNSPEFCCYWHL